MTKEEVCESKTEENSQSFCICSMMGALYVARVDFMQHRVEMASDLVGR